MIDGDEIAYRKGAVSSRITHDNQHELGSRWLEHVQRKTYDRGGLWAPPTVAPARALNLWRGFAVEPRPGGWQLMRRHIREVIAAGDKAVDEYVVRWCAWLVQHPGERAEAAVVLRGGEGTGKGTLGNALCSIFGAHASHPTSPEHFVGSRFNGHQERARSSRMFADECYWAGDRAHEGELKGMITEPERVFERKGIDPYRGRNCLHVLVSSNNEWVVPAGIDARRFVASDVSPARKGDAAYFAALYGELYEDGDIRRPGAGIAAMLHELLAMDPGRLAPARDDRQRGPARSRRSEA